MVSCCRRYFQGCFHEQKFDGKDQRTPHRYKMHVNVICSIFPWTNSLIDLDGLTHAVSCPVMRFAFLIHWNSIQDTDYCLSREFLICHSQHTVYLCVSQFMRWTLIYWTLLQRLDIWRINHLTIFYSRTLKTQKSTLFLKTISCLSRWMGQLFHHN